MTGSECEETETVVAELKVTENTVAICMATYNGEQFLSEQIDSILAQSWQDWILFIRDDGSKDATAAILREYQSRYSEKICVIDDPCLEGGSAKKNFAAIVEWVKTHDSFRYFMCSDQDDYWLPDKIEKSLNALKEVEERTHGPVLLHTDLKVVDEQLREIYPSFFRCTRLNPNVKDLSHLLVQNNVTGCTVMWNRALNDKVSLSNDDAMMHDWWLALAACCFGEIVCLREPTILYRQHGDNAVGAKDSNYSTYTLRAIKGEAHIRGSLRATMRQAKGFLNAFRDELSPDQITTVENYANLLTLGKFRRVLAVLKGHYLRMGFSRAVFELLYILFM